MENLLLLYEKQGSPEGGDPEVDYMKALSNIVPVLTKNSDKIGGSTFKIGWSIS